MIGDPVHKGWFFTGDEGEFVLDSPQKTSYLYFPLFNYEGMISSVTPLFHGDIKMGQNTFLMAPVTAEDLHNTRSARNFWVFSGKTGAWSATGNSPKQIEQSFSEEFEEKVLLEAGFLWQKVTRENNKLGLKSEITSFVPVDGHHVELMKVNITNTGGDTVEITPTAAIPIFGRSAENIRDHRHVSSLLHRIAATTEGVQVKPAMSFDERGHKINDITYCVFGAEDNGKLPCGFFPVLEEFIGEGGCLEWPEAVVKNLQCASELNAEYEGYEAIGGLRFSTVELKPGESKGYVIAMAVCEKETEKGDIGQVYCNEAAFNKYLEDNKMFWRSKLDTPVFKTGDDTFDKWMKWVTLQPVIRRIYGCSFLPHHDYGKGGRGWRDLWQDCLALLIIDPAGARNLLLDNFAGVRMDGSNANIIGSRPGEFIADRNNISRVWMDHGTWPFLTTMLYLDQSGDLSFLHENQVYFRDCHIRRSSGIDNGWKPEDGSHLHDRHGKIYQGSVLEHLLVQNLVPFFNVGENNNIKMEGADWNDAFDMAEDKGESVAFTALYGSNLIKLGELISTLSKVTGNGKIQVAAEMALLLDTISGSIDYDSVSQKLSLRNEYYDLLQIFSGEKIELTASQVANDLIRKGSWIAEHLRKSEWIRDEEGNEWFNGYYDNNGKRVEGSFPPGTRMTLTGQVFTVMGGIASDEQVDRVIASVNKYLYDEKLQGYRLNTSFGGLQPNIGRCFGFAYGHKENGAVFSHMAVMYGNALYKRGHAAEGYNVLNSLYELSKNFEKSRIYPGLPEYFNNRGRGMYSYLTGSASWLLLTMLTVVFGVKGSYGDLLLEPKLLECQFDKDRRAGVVTEFQGRRLKIVYINDLLLDYGKYRILSVKANGKELTVSLNGNSAVIKKEELEKLDTSALHVLEIQLHYSAGLEQKSEDPNKKIKRK